jgi:hypothetical protein
VKRLFVIAMLFLALAGGMVGCGGGTTVKPTAPTKTGG